jgi:hypothetical protein
VCSLGVTVPAALVAATRYQSVVLLTVAVLTRLAAPLFSLSSRWLVPSNSIATHVSRDSTVTAVTQPGDSAYRCVIVRATSSTLRTRT